MRRALPELLRSRGQGAPALQPSLEAGQHGPGSAATSAAAAVVAAAAAAGPGGEAAADSRSEDVLLRALQAQRLQQP